MELPAGVSTSTYTYAGSNSRLVRNKLVTTTYAYDNNGNLIQKTVDGTSTTYVWDYVL
jgi:YD repeat-containing protein